MNRMKTVQGFITYYFIERFQQHPSFHMHYVSATQKLKLFSRKPTPTFSFFSSFISGAKNQDKDENEVENEEVDEVEDEEVLDEVVDEVEDEDVLDEENVDEVEEEENLTKERKKRRVGQEEEEEKRQKKQEYRKRKKQAIEDCLSLLDDWKDYFMHQTKKKKDDLADCYLQALAYFHSDKNK